MNIYILLSQKSGGVYASATADGNKVVQMFKHEDDAERFRLWLEADGKDADLTVESTDLDTVVGNCKVFGYSYSIIDSDEFIIPA